MPDKSNQMHSTMLRKKGFFAYVCRIIVGIGSKLQGDGLSW